MYSLRAVSVSAQPKPLDLAAIKLHLRVLHEHDDAYIKDLIVAAMQSAEHETHRQIITATYELALDRFPPAGVPIYLPLPPWAVTNSVQYYGTAGDLQTWSSANYFTLAREPAEIWTVPEVVWPTTQLRAGAVLVNFDCGYGTLPANVPALSRHAMQLLVAHWYMNRTAVVTGTIAVEIPRTVQHIFEQLRVGDDFTNYEPAVCR